MRLNSMTTQANMPSTVLLIGLGTQCVTLLKALTTYVGNES